MTIFSTSIELFLPARDLFLLAKEIFHSIREIFRHIKKCLNMSLRSPDGFDLAIQKLEEKSSTDTVLVLTIGDTLVIDTAGTIVLLTDT